MARKILLADDSVTAQNMGRKILADAGYEVITVNNGSAALKKISEVKPDLVILDVYMPGYSGLEVCQRLKEMPDSSRVPVLLTVGKLEPFKPEEAQRVRAEAFIVKPFEASELLSMLSKLEDKVVPRAESSKPGRFARTIAAVEESSRGQIQPIDGGDDNGWKSRINFPHQKKKSEEKDVDDASIYNAVNRDLRTVVASAAERVEENKEEKRLHEMAVEPSVDVAAVAPTGVPQDVTPEEVAAIAAAAAHIQALQQTLNEEKEAESAPAEPGAAEIAIASDAAQATEGTTSVPAEAVAAAEFQSVQDEARSAQNEAEDLPMTMAAAAPAASRWTAVAVALDTDEANISLEREMQKLYTASVAEPTPSAEEKSEAIAGESAAVSPETEKIAEIASSIVETQAERQAEPEPPVESPVAVEAHRDETAAAAEQAPVASFAPSEPVVDLQALSAVPPAEPADRTSAAEVVAAEAQIEAVVSQVAEAAAVEPVATAEPAPATVEVAQESHSPAPPEPEAAPVAAAEHPFTSFVSSAQAADAQEQRLEQLHKVESAREEAESVKTTAAAWASWRQVRDANEPNPADAQKTGEQESTIAAEATVAAAMAVAAGAEQIAQEVSPGKPENPADVASIVDSVLADLRPRLMAEISRKMAEKK